MDKRQARAYVLRCLAAEARHHEGNASEWLSRPLSSDGIAVSEEGEFSEKDYARVVDALNEVADELERRSVRLMKQPAPR